MTSQAVHQARSAPRRVLHLREYAIEAAALGTFMVSAVVFTVLLEHPVSPVRDVLPNPVVRRGLTGVAMGLTAIALIYSPAGRLSGLHMNPAVTLTFLRLGKMRPVDAAGYVLGQFAGATLVMAALAWLGRPWLADPAVNFVQTLPGPAGQGVAFAAETLISMGMMLLVLTLSSSPRWAGFTGLCAGGLVAAYITIEAPLSGMSMNPARTFGPALVGGTLAPLWLYCTAPLAGMLAASEIHVRRRGLHSVRCAKLHHDPRFPCLFHCTHGLAVREPASIAAAGQAGGAPPPAPHTTNEVHA
jgi:aquaporin Z